MTGLLGCAVIRSMLQWPALAIFSTLVLLGAHSDAKAAACEDFSLVAVHVTHPQGGALFYENSLINPTGRFLFRPQNGWPDAVILTLVWLPTAYPNTQLMGLAISAPVTLYINGRYAGPVTVTMDLQFTRTVVLEPDPSLWPMTAVIELGAVRINDTCTSHRSIPAVIDYYRPIGALSAEEKILLPPIKLRDPGLSAEEKILLTPVK
jgi:hypothetical protein